MLITATKPHEGDVATRASDAFATTADKWQAVVGRDHRADGVFFYAVRTTGVYCRPSCAARLANRGNVSFHATPEDARGAGFRACKRCRPDEVAADSLENLAVAAVARLIDAAIADERPVPPLAALADKAGFSMFHFHRMFRRVLGLTPRAYAAAARNRRMATELRDSASVTEAIHGAGYSSSSRFYETATARLGMAPRVHRAGGQGEAIQYTVVPSSLGRVLVAETARGVCAIALGDDDDALVADLRARFPRAGLTRGEADFSATVAGVVALVEQPGQGHALPLDVRGTAFQERVWQALRAIPAGQTASYAQIAHAIGRPDAARGVARACAANPTAVAIPCHRVVRADGALSGYRWGVARKAALLAREGAR